MRGLAGEMDTLAVAEDRAAAGSKRMEAASSRMGGALGFAAKGAVGVAAVVIGIGAAASRASIQFNHEMLRIRTDAGASTAELKRMKTGVLDLAASGASMGQGPQSLAEGLYHLESLGIRGSKALFALKLASQESAISGANLEQTTSALGAAMFVGIKGTGGLTHLMGILNATVGAGNMRFQDLVEALGTGVLPSAKVAGLGITDVSAALAVATDSGYKASSAAAQLGTAFHFLYAPSSKAAGALAAIHLPADQLAKDMHKPQGLLVALTDLHNHLQGLSKVQQAQTLNAILPGGRGRILLTELTMLDRLRGKYKQVNETAGGQGAAVAAQRRDPGTQLKTAEARIQADMIRLGNVITPVVVPALAKLLGVGADVLEWLVKLPDAIHNATKFFSAGAGSVKGFEGSVTKSWHSIENTTAGLWRAIRTAFAQILKAGHDTFNVGFFKDLATIGKQLLWFGSLVFGVLGKIAKMELPGLVMAVRGGFNVIAGLVKFIAGILTLNFGKAWAGLKQMFHGGLQQLVGQFTAFTAPLRAAAGFLWKGLTSGISAAFNAVKGVVVGAINWIINQINGVINAVNSVSGSLPFGIGGGLHIGTIGTIGTGGDSGPVVTGHANSSVRQKGLSFSTPGHQGVARNVVRAGPRAEAAGGWNHGDIVVQAGTQTLIRVHRRDLIRAMAANA